MKKQAADGIVIVKKYANRRLYNTETSSYITLDHLAAMIRAGRDFKVVDAKTDEDITHNVLTQIIMEEESRGETMLPVNFLRQLISMYGDSMQAVVPGYLEASMDSFRRNQEQFKSAVEGAFAGTPFADMAKRNLAMFEAATQGFKAATPAAAPAPTPAAPAASKDAEMAALKAELAALKDKIEKLGE
ncbi:polyhydroxyalkanoate synthesis repressor PhaR [Sphingomonas sanguinis]|jgi:polyhydroxyalkanoate synthesis repressor PhaR|uniref:Polyhydroxyalkanoate synthesis repressor PhaR n=1 Tax=Sphingomonas sanguinis TaxID=33051 RepID=A0A147J9P0_9SPHN|nr:polyhydroxyalkanoate synthesis repressor PhaR [Sphingomonas sanguinis]KTW14557.1 polyhydroxyalkanoate synthesis repressor PhaR [Sphingomonas sanguinis]MBZ6382530.1 polyhydroxyalkanoate synthesis repressor PhaR [Sphingomonas sanguinis]NNG49829.1 polyhydroxyalkanoate synthesis repressor PhaR [Sphingomonas sanguinis]NNG54785.1 polyhydroxyalkanoate synthesis repressor PhaR [Sphingomonas sanguinis]NVP31828.1 polyhydroxyalkanoate synthesis repressor PhaR [Sphingomonas sanguinis]